MLYENIKAVCKEKNIPMYQVEDDTGLPRGSISKWQTVKPSYDKVKAVATRLEVSMDSLVD